MVWAPFRPVGSPLPLLGAGHIPTNARICQPRALTNPTRRTDLPTDYILGVLMGRIRWVNVSVAAVCLIVVVYAALALVGIAHLPDVFGGDGSGSQSLASLAAASPPQAAAAQQQT